MKSPSDPSLPIVLTAEELQQLTGMKRPSKMTDWLVERGWVHERPARPGQVPRVDRTYYLQRMSGTLPAGTGPAARVQPRFDFMVTPRRSRHETA